MLGRKNAAVRRIHTHSWSCDMIFSMLLLRVPARNRESLGTGHPPGLRLNTRMLHVSYYRYEKYLVGWYHVYTANCTTHNSKQTAAAAAADCNYNSNNNSCKRVSGIRFVELRHLHDVKHPPKRRTPTPYRWHGDRIIPATVNYYKVDCTKHLTSTTAVCLQSVQQWELGDRR